MTYTSLSRAETRRLPALGTLVLLLALGCGDDGGATGSGGGGGTGGSDAPPGCALQTFSGEPDILVFPSFPPVISPGSDVELSILVDDDTRLAEVTLMWAWRLRSTSSAQPTQTIIQNTLGNETLDFVIPTVANISGLYYADIKLCGRTCEESEVHYTLNRANAGPESDAINDPYERIAFVGGEETRSTFTCDRPDVVAFQ